ncbi:glycosyltransferase [Candidatus Pelagibacter sp.]|uniref:glycosyltransferase n=1 Tax=Candidatus Pelagibacter sp. TaxID=2024849 RepID=UPI003F866BD9
MLKILSVTYKDSTSGGPYRVAVDHKNCLDNKEFNLKFFKYDKNLKLKFIFNSSKIKKFINKFDLIHLHNLFSIDTIIIIKIAELLSIPTVLSLHGNLNEWSMKKNNFLKMLFLLFFRKNINSISIIHFLNNVEKEEASKFIDIKKIPYTINQNCIDVSKFKITRNNDSNFNILFFGRLDKKKNFLKIPEIANFFKKNAIQNIKFLIVGPSTVENLNLLKKKISEFNVEDLIEIRSPINSINQKNSLFDEIDIFILPSEDEADSVAIKEALASGKPVVISKECKFVLDTKNQEFIKIINNKSPRSYYNELLKFYYDREKLNKLAKKIHQYSRENFSMESLVKWLPVIYKKCINHTHRNKNL